MNIVRKAIGPLFRVYRFLRLYSQHLNVAFSAVFSMPVAVSKLEGRLKGRRETVSILYVGRRMNFDYLRAMIFDEHREVDYRRSNLFAYRKQMDRLSGSADVLILDLGWPYNGFKRRKGGYTEVPDWMDMTLIFPEGGWDAVVRNFRRTARKHDLRLIRRNAYRSETVNTPEAAEAFYDEMYLPFVQYRHAGSSVLTSKRKVVKQTTQGHLLRILRGAEIVAAGVLYPEDDVLYSLWMGLPRKYLQRQPEAAISALYYFGIKHAFDNGYEAFEFGGTRAFLGDGVYQFKRRWGAFIDDQFSPNSILIRPRNGNRNAALVCQALPVLRRTPRGLEGLVVRVDAPVGADSPRQLEKDFGCAGLERMTVIDVSEENETAPISVRDDKCEYRLLRCPLERFGDCYVSDSPQPDEIDCEPQGDAVRERQNA